MDGFLPPVDQSSWLDYQRRRAERFARERIAAAGSGAGDWIGRATQAVDTLIPDWAQPQPPPPPPPEPEPIAPVSLGMAPGLAQVGDWTRGALDRIGQIGGDLGGMGTSLGQEIGSRLRGATPRVVPDAEQPGGERVELGGVTRNIPLPPAWEGARPGLEKYAEDVASAGRYLTQRPEEIPPALQTASGFLPGGFTSRTLPRVLSGQGAGVLGEAQRAAPTLGALATVAPVPSMQIGEAAADVVTEGLGRAGVPAPLAGAAGFAADVLTPDVGTGARVGTRLGARGGWAQGLSDLAERYGTDLEPAFGEIAGAPGGRRRVTASTLQSAGEAARVATRSKNGISPDWGEPPPGGWVDPVSKERVVPPQAGEPISASEFGYWDDLRRGRNPLPGLSPRTGGEATIKRPRTRWDLYNAPPELGPNGELPGKLDMSPLPRVDWDTLLAEQGFTPSIDPALLKRILTAYDDDDLKVETVVRTLGLPGSEGARLTGEAKAVATEANRALNALGTPYKKTQSEWGAIKSEREEGGKFAYFSPKMNKTFYFDSAPEVAAAMRFDADPRVVEYVKGGGKRARVRFVINPASRFDPNPPEGLEILRTQGILDAGKEGIYSPDFLVRGYTSEEDAARALAGEDVPLSEGIVEVKSLAAPNQPAYKIEEKTRFARDVFENHWGIPFHILGEDQIGRRFMADLGARNPADPDEVLARVGQDLTDPAAQQRMRRAFVQHMRSGASTARTDLGPTWLEPGAPVKEATDEYIDFNAASKYPPIVGEPMQRLPQYLSGARNQAAWHNRVGTSGSTFSTTGDSTVRPGGEGFMVAVAPERMQRVVGHQLSARRLAQFVIENEDYFRRFPELRVGTWKAVEPNGTPITQLDLVLHTPDGQAASDIANLYRQKAVYNIKHNMAVATNQDDWLPTRLTRDERDERLTQILERSRAGAVPAAERGDYPLGEANARILARAERDAARRARGAGGLAGAAAGRRGRAAGLVPAAPEPADRAGAVAGAGVPEPLGNAPGDGTVPGLAGDGRGGLGLGGPGGAGIAAQPGAAGPGLAFGAAGDALQRALRSVEPYGAARTAGERAFDITGGTAGAVAGAASAEEDATWQERARRAAAGAVAGSLVGPTARGSLGVLGRGLRDGEALGAAAGAARRPQSPTGRPSLLADAASALASVPLMAPPSLAANFSGGALRTFERVLGQVAELRPIDALYDAGAMLRELPGAARRFPAAVRAGPTPDAPGVTGLATQGDLLSREGALPFAATLGTRLNAATDQFWRDLNEAGAGAVARRRGLGAAESAGFRQRAGDFATFGGPNSLVAQKLTEIKATLNDPKATPAAKAQAFAVQAFAPYIMMPERLLRAAVESSIPLAHAPAVVKALKRGDRRAAREAAGKMALSAGVLWALWNAAEQGTLTGPAPQNPAERKRREALGEEWETIALPGVGRVPLRYAGAFGQSASLIASLHDAVEKGAAEGAGFADHLGTLSGEAIRWTLDESYLRDFGRFIREAQQGRGGQALAGTLAATPARIVSPLAGIASAADPYEREVEGIPAQVASRAGLRAVLPARIDPATGEFQRRAGSGLSRYWGRRGAVESDVGAELARAELAPRELGPREEYAGAKQTPEQRRVLQQALGSETAKAVRETTASPRYQQADAPGKKRLLEAAKRRAAEEADIIAGDRVARDAKSQATRKWDAVPKFVGIDPKADADTIRRENARISRALALASQYRGQYGEGPWRAKMAQEEPEAYKLITRARRPAELLRREREAIEAEYGVELS